MRKRILAVSFFATAALGLPMTAPTPALAAPPQHESNTQHHVTETFADILPCADGGYYLITTTANQTEHATFTDTSGHFTFTETGTFQASPTEVVITTDPDGEPVVTPTGPRPGPTYSGHFTIWGGGSFNDKRSVTTFTFRIHGTGSDGTTLSFHENAHATTDGPGDPEDPATPVKVAFDKARC